MKYLVILLLIILYLIIREIKSFADKLKHINQEEATNLRMTVDFRFFGLEDLAKEINNLLILENSKKSKLRKEQESIKRQITSISHDLRTPLTSILGYIELLKKTKSQEDRDKYLDILSTKGAVLQKLVAEFYEITLIEDQNYNLEIREIEIGYLLEDTIMTYYNEFKEKNIDLNIEIDYNRTTPVDSNSLQRAFENLITNMLKYGLETASIKHVESENLTYTIFSNKIKEDSNIDINKMFEKFYRGESSRHGESTGLGLYYTKVVIEKMGGEIHAKQRDQQLDIIIKY